MTDPVPHEQSVLGALLISGAKPLSILLVEEHLRPEHFDRPRHQTIYRAMLSLHDRDEPVDVTTVQAELERMSADVDEAYLHSLPNVVALAANFRHYGRRVIELARLRAKRLAAQEIIESVEREDHGAIADAEAKLASAETRPSSSLEPTAWADALCNAIESPAEAFPFCFETLNRYTVGGMRRKGTTLIGGWTNTGKSILVDQILERAAWDGAKVHLYINEMGLEERGFRLVSRSAVVPYWRLAQSKLTDEDRPRVMRALNELPFGVTECAGWTADEIAHDIRRRRWDVCAIDILHRIEHREERDLARMSTLLTDAAKRASAHVVMAVHLNEARATGAELPRPALRDIRGSGSLKNDADNVLFVWRKMDQDRMLDEGRIYFAKVRSGVAGGMDVVFNSKRMCFQLPADVHAGSEAA